jgi:hypothetical protein
MYDPIAQKLVTTFISSSMCEAMRLCSAVVTNCYQNELLFSHRVHHLPAGIYGFFGGKKFKFLLPATTEEHIAHVNLLRKASETLILMTINALIAIRLSHLLW